MPIYSLAHLTALSLTPPELLDVARETGYDAVSLRLLPAAPGGVAYQLMDDPAMMRETLARLNDGAVKVFDIELIRIGEGFDVERYKPLLETSAQLGAVSVLVAGDDTDRARLAANYAQLCEVMKPYGLNGELEFMPWVAMADLNDAIEVLTLAGLPSNGGILVDGIHFDRSGSTYEQLAQVPTQYFHYAQLCDAKRHPPYTIEQLVYTARQERLLPGEGDIDLAKLFSRLPKDLPVCVEIPHATRYAQLGAKAWAAEALASAKALIARAERLRIV